jgi:cytochrome c oxidase subunit III
MARQIPIANRLSAGHGGGPYPPRSGGGDGDERGRNPGDGLPHDDLPNYGERLRRARLGLAVAMTPILMLFGTFTVAYLVRRGYLAFELNSQSFVSTWLPIRLPWSVLLLNTAILIASSVTMELARRAITRQAALAPVRSIPGVSLGDEREMPWLALTTCLGVLFLAGQFYVWRQLGAHGFHLAGAPSSSFVYLLTGMHGLHLAGGALVLLSSNLAAWLHKPIETRRIVVDITAWYWHTMTAVWIYILVLLSFATH